MVLKEPRITKRNKEKETFPVSSSKDWVIIIKFDIVTIIITKSKSAIENIRATNLFENKNEKQIRTHSFPSCAKHAKQGHCQKLALTPFCMNSSNTLSQVSNTQN